MPAAPKENEVYKKYELVNHETEYDGSDFSGHINVCPGVCHCVDHKHTLQINWPKAERGDGPIRIGLCHLQNIDNRDKKVATDAWLWELPSKRLLRKQYVNGSMVDKPHFPQTLYPVDEPMNEPEGSWELPSDFDMILDMDEGTLSFRISDQELGVAFNDDLKGKALYLALFACKPNFEVAVVELITKT